MESHLPSTKAVTITASFPALPSELQSTDNDAALTYVHAATGNFRRPLIQQARCQRTGTEQRVRRGRCTRPDSESRAVRRRQERSYSLASVDASTSAIEHQSRWPRRGPNFRLVMRLQDSQNYWRFGRSQNQAYQLQQIVQNQLGTPVVTTLSTVMPAAGDALSCRSIQTLLECGVNGVPVVRASSAVGNTATRGRSYWVLVDSVRFEIL